MSTPEGYANLLNKGYAVDQCCYNANDALESNADLEQLLEVLCSVRDKHGRPACLTANNIVANPDFARIEAADYKHYFYEPFTQTLARFPGRDKVMDLYAEGRRIRAIQPQFHGREHLQIDRWLAALQTGDKATHDALAQGVFSPKIASDTGYVLEYMDALSYEDTSELEVQKTRLRAGLDLFAEIWGMRSKSFIAPCYIWDSALEPFLGEHGVLYLQGILKQLQPLAGSGHATRSVIHYQGQRNAQGQRYLVRNAFFEPTIRPSIDWVDDCLARIAVAFRWRKPAVIGSHRLNYIGSLRPANREQNLPLLRQLLQEIVRRWPQVEFMSSDELGDTMNAEP